MAAASVSFGRQRLDTRAQIPTRPLGEKSTKPMKISPNHSSQLPVQMERISRNRM